MSDDTHLIGGPLDGYTVPVGQLNGADQYTDIETGSVYTRQTANMFMYTHAGPPTPGSGLALIGPLTEVTVHGTKLMTIAQMQQFLGAARAAGYPDTHVPRVVNSFSGRIRALTAKAPRHTDK